MKYLSTELTTLNIKKTTAYDVMHIKYSVHVYYVNQINSYNMHLKLNRFNFFLTIYVDDVLNIQSLPWYPS